MKKEDIDKANVENLEEVKPDYFHYVKGQGFASMGRSAPEDGFGWVDGEPVFDKSDDFKEMLQSYHCTRNDCEGRVVKRSTGRWQCEECLQWVSRGLIHQYGVDDLY